MEYFRLYEKVPGRSPLGFGNAGGRWNVPGVPMIYACRYSALNFLEMLSIRGPVVTSVPWVLVVFEFKEEPQHLSVSALPAHWNALPYGEGTVRIGSQWSEECEMPFLLVPSARLPLERYPDEHNVLINPLFPGVEERIKIIDAIDVGFLVNA